MQTKHPSEDVNDYQEKSSQFQHPLLSKDMQGIKKFPSSNAAYSGRFAAN